MNSIAIILLVVSCFHCHTECFYCKSPYEFRNVLEFAGNVADVPESARSHQRRTVEGGIERFLKSSFITTSVLTKLSTETLAAGDSSNGAVGFEAAESAFAPFKSLYVVPALPQSALINTLPIGNKLVGQIQGFLESFVQLIRPNERQKAQIATPNSPLWKNLKINAQRAAGMLFYNEKRLIPIVFSKEPSDIQALRIQFSDVYVAELKHNVLGLVNASKAEDVALSLRYMEASLNSLHFVAYTQVPLYEETATAYLWPADDRLRDRRLRAQLASLPHLLGRAVLKLTFARPALLSMGQDKVLGDESEVREGLHYPLAAGNIVVLCLRERYDNAALRMRTVDFSPSLTNKTLVSFGVIGADSNEGTSASGADEDRHVPLEVYREDEGGVRTTAVGAARNSPLFTKAFPVYSFATVSSIDSCAHYIRADG